jgi:hypothetical protein
LAWGKLHRWYGTYLELVATEDEAIKKFGSAEKGAVRAKDATLQRYWYAHWIHEHVMKRHPAGKRKSAREDADQEIADLCWAIHKGRIKPIKYDKKWFARITTELDDGVKSEASATRNRSLLTTYARCSYKEIREMVANPFLTTAHLPPLAVPAFGDHRTLEGAVTRRT